MQIRADVSRVSFHGMVSKTAEGDHLPISIEIVHDGTSLKNVDRDAGNHFQGGDLGKK